MFKVSGFGLEDGFFDVGGDLFLVVVVVEWIKKELDCEFSVIELFEYFIICVVS